MKTFLRRARTAFSLATNRLQDAASTAYYNAGARLTVFLANEPVRARSFVASALVAAGAVVPGLATGRVDEIIAGAIVSAATVALGESARKKVSPADEK